MDIASRIGSRFRAEFTAKIISVICGGLLVVVLARLLDPDSYGLLFLAISVFAFAELFSKLGIAKSTARYITKYKETDEGQIPHIIRYGLMLNITTIAITCLVFVLIHGHISAFLGEPNLAPFLIFGVLFILFESLTKFCRLTLQGFEDIRASSTLYSIDKITRLIFAVTFVLLGYGAIGALVGYILAFVAASAFGLSYLYVRHYRRIEPNEREPGLRRRLAEYMVPLVATDTADVLDKRVDILMVGFFVGPAGVAFYTVGKQVVNFVETPLAALGFTLSPTYEAQKAKGNPDTAARIYEEALSYGFLLYIPAAAGLVLVAEPLIDVFFGSRYLGAVPVLQVLGIYAVLQAVTTLTSNGLDYLGRARERAIVKGITSVLNVGLNLILIPTIGVVGAAISTVITYGMYTLANFYIMHTELDLRTTGLIHHFAQVTFVTVIMSVVVYAVIGYVDGLISLLAIVGVGVAVWAVLAIGLGLVRPKRVVSLLL